MRIHQEKKDFKNVVITLESQKEFDFFFELFNISEEKNKKNMEDYNKKLDYDFYNLLRTIKHPKVDDEDDKDDDDDDKNYF